MQKSGLVYATGAYVLWGLFPIYWKWLNHVSPMYCLFISYSLDDRSCSPVVQGFLAKMP